MRRDREAQGTCHTICNVIGASGQVAEQAASWCCPSSILSVGLTTICRSGLLFELFRSLLLQASAIVVSESEFKLQRMLAWNSKGFSDFGEVYCMIVVIVDW